WDPIVSLLLGWPNVMRTKKGRPVRRIVGIALLVLPVVALVVGWRIWTRPPALVVSLRALPEVAKVEYKGSANAPLFVVHFLDWHFVPPDLCKLDGIDFEANLDTVEKVQEDQLAIALYLIHEHGLQDVSHEGVTEETLPDLRVRLDLLKTLDRLAALGGMDDAARRHRREHTLLVGAPGRLLHSGEIGAVRILED